MPRYFFTIRALNGDLEHDPSGKFLPDIAAALTHAERIISQLHKESGYDDPALMMLVKDETGRTVLYLPFVAGGD